MNTVTIGIEVDQKAGVVAVRQLGGEIHGTKASFEKTGKVGNVVMTGLKRDTEKARDAMDFLSRTTGVELPRSFQKVIASSAGMRTALSSAFNISVVAGFAAAIATLVVEAIIKAQNYLNRFEDELAQQAYDAQVRANKIIIDATEKNRALRFEIDKIGAKDRIKLYLETAEKLQKVDEQIDQLRQAAKKKGMQVDLQEVTSLEEQQKLIREEHWKKSEEIKREEVKKTAQKQIEMAEAVFRVQVALGQIKLSSLEDVKLVGKITDAPGILAQRQRILDAARRAAQEVGIDPTHGIGGEVFREGSRRGEAFDDVMAAHLKQYRDDALARFREMQEAHQQMVEQMAGHLRAFVSNPLQYLKERFIQAMFEMAASALLAFSGRGATASGGGGILGSIFGGLFGGGSSGGGGMFRTPPFLPGAMPFAGGGSAASVLGGLPLGHTGSESSLFGVPFSAGGGASTFGVMPAGATRGGGLGASLMGMLPGAIAGGGLFGASRIGFGGPGRGAVSGGLLAAAGLGAFAVGAGGNIAASLGFLFGGPIGWLALGAGALIGALFGIFSRGKKQKQRDAVEAEAFRAIRQIKDAYDVKAVDYLSAIGQLEQVRQQVNQAMAQLKWPSRMDPHIDAAIRHINSVEQERQRRLETPFGPPQFAAGGMITQAHAPFRSTTGNVIPFPVNSATAARHYDAGGAVPIIAHAGEYVLKASAVRRIGKHNLDAMNNGGMPGGQGNTLNFYGPLVQAQTVDEAWLNNGGAEKIVRAIQRARWEGAA